MRFGLPQFPITNNTDVALYSDDSAIYTSSKDFGTIIQNIQAHLNEIQRWREKWKMILNPQKNTTVPTPHQPSLKNSW